MCFFAALFASESRICRKPAKQQPDRARSWGLFRELLVHLSLCYDSDTRRARESDVGVADMYAPMLWQHIWIATHGTGAQMFADSDHDLA